MKKEKQKTTQSKQRLWIGVGVIAVIAVALLFGLGALSIQPTESGSATISLFTRDGTQVNASDNYFVLYSCNYSDVDADKVELFINDFTNYEEIDVDPKDIVNLNLNVKIEENCVIVLEITDNDYVAEWHQIAPGENRLLLNEKPASTTFNGGQWNLEDTCFKIDIQLLNSTGSQNLNISLPAFIDNARTGEREFLTVILSGSVNFTDDLIDYEYGKAFVDETGKFYMQFSMSFSSGFDFKCNVNAQITKINSGKIVYTDAEFNITQEIANFN